MDFLKSCNKCASLSQAKNGAAMLRTLYSSLNYEIILALSTHPIMYVSRVSLWMNMSEELDPLFDSTLKQRWSWKEAIT